METLTAISIIAEVFDFGRFASARDFMSYLGLTPSEYSSWEKEHTVIVLSAVSSSPETGGISTLSAIDKLRGNFQIKKDCIDAKV
ncbi:transposase [Planctomycetota bacterium]